MNNYKNIMREISLRSSDIDSFKYSILISLHYYDISFHPERISKLKPFENKYNFKNITPNEFETNNPNISLTDRYSAIKQLKNKFIKLNKLLESFLHIELREHILQNILKNEIHEVQIKNIDN